MQRPPVPLPTLLAALLLPAALLPACAREGDGPRPPVPEELDALDPVVVQRVQAALRGVERAPGSADAWSELGMVYHANGLAALARPAYARAMELAPDDAKHPYRRALSALAEGDEGAALADLERAVSLAPGSPVPPWRLGSVLLEGGRLAEASRAFERSLAANPGFLPARIGRARVQLLDDRAEEAVETLEAVLAEVPRHRHARELLATALRQAGLEEDGGRARATTFEPQAYDPWEDQVLQHRAESRLAQAVRLLTRDHPERALPLLEAERALAPDSPAVLGNLAEAYDGVGRTTEAREVLEHALAVQPESVRFHLALAGLLEEEGRRDEALALLRRAIALAPERGELYGHVSRLLYEAERYDEAVVALRESLRRDGRDPRMWTWLGTSELAVGSAEAAEEAFATAAGFPAPPLDAWLGLATARLGLGELDGAEQALEAARGRAAELRRVDAARDERIARLERALARARAGEAGQDADAGEGGSR